MWSQESHIFKGTLLAGVYLQDLVERCSGKVLQVQIVKGSEVDFLPDEVIWEKFGKLLSDQLTGRNKLETSFTDTILEKFPKDFVEKPIVKAPVIKTARRNVKKDLEREATQKEETKKANQKRKVKEGEKLEKSLRDHYASRAAEIGSHLKERAKSEKLKQQAVLKETLTKLAEQG